ncbi:hypothetical protein G5B40_04640 [Pikeienuella piscinae]|uniref:LVIVD repeat-containing protein n=1 Tax=Pikeienuella piscinae TaxID=2748098 RepID=A0A7L5BTK8_9RHOB|nr:hypothetical protein [Pikeienuella piscinae]QIE54792.1 hypothetical protein G5B40_04640 [Pikeienuella piscinae]
MTRFSIAFAIAIAGAAAFGAGGAFAAGGEKPVERDYPVYPPAPAGQSPAEVAVKSAGCMSCHEKTDSATMHISGAIALGCTDCHGGDAGVFREPSAAPGSHEYVEALEHAHVLPRYPETWHWPTSANPKRSYTLINKESPEYLRFINPSDYRVVRESCGACHMREIQAAERSLMSTAAMFWGGASYNNGVLPFKRYVLGEAFTRDGEPAIVDSPVKLNQKMINRGALPKLYPLPAWEVIPPGDVFRVFERGGRNIVTQFPEIGLPNALGQLQRLEEPGRPDIRQSNRGPATGIRIAIPVLNILKTRLNDPHMWFMGTNDQPGDYRSSGCSGCHVPYANDREWVSSGQYAKYGNKGQTATIDPTINGEHFPEMKGEKGHPIRHAFTSAIPTSQCMSCHMHQPNMFLNTYLGYTMWDYESDAPLMWPDRQINRRDRDIGQHRRKEEKTPTRSYMHQEAHAEEPYGPWARMREILNRNPEAAAAVGKWGDLNFLEEVWKDVNPRANDTQFADYHGHGWNFRAVFKRDREGNLLDKAGGVVSNDDPKRFDKAVHMNSIHAEKGMHCVDCHFSQDGHGTGYIHGEVAQAVQIRCKDCHGTVDEYPTLRTSGPAARPGGEDLTLLRNPDGKRRFEWVNGGLIQRSIVNPDLEWRVSLVRSSVTPGRWNYNEKSARAKLMAKLDGPNDTSMDWGRNVPKSNRAHNDEEIACFACHTSWTTSCGGCHLPIEANWKTEHHHYEDGLETRNWASYNPQVARDQIFQLGKHGPVKSGIIAPIRSSSALVLSSTNINRERIYVQQPPVAASGYSSQAFAPHFPHTARTEETKTCTDCHISEENDNNAIMAQLLLQGTNFIDFIGHHSYIGEVGGLQAVRVTEWEEPQAVFGSYLHRYAYPDDWRMMQNRNKELAWDERNMVSSQSAPGTVSCLQLRGEYLYAAQGDGVQVYDVASIGNKGVSDRILTAPFGPLGHDAHIDTKHATCIALPTEQPIAPFKQEKYGAELMFETNLEQPFHPLYKYAYVTDAEEGLILFDNETFQDGEPRNNFIERAVTFNPNGALNGASYLLVRGEYVYITTPRAVVVVNIDKPLTPRLVAEIPMQGARYLDHQFRYLFVTDSRGLNVIDVTNQETPFLVPDAFVPIADARNLHVARTYAYVAAGAEGLVIVDVKNPEKPKIFMKENFGGAMNDATDIVIGTTNASLFGYVADGRNGLKVLQLTSPSSQPNFYGFSPEPKPQLIAWYETDGAAVALSGGLKRDRAVDENGNQIAVFGRIGSRPFNEPEQRAFYQKDGAIYRVRD